MIHENESIAEQLTKRNIKPSLHRIKVLEYLKTKRNHPTVEQIYSSIKNEVPTLSKATIYNTLSLFVKARLVRTVMHEDNETRYDYTIEDHGHFKCESCGTIFDFVINIDDLVAEGLDDFVISDKDVYFKGICPGCLLNNKKQ